ncbi:MAG: hypothetical protein ACRDPY_39615 [Streptosporangiaceae bacterium]
MRTHSRPGRGYAADTERIRKAGPSAGRRAEPQWPLIPGRFLFSPAIVAGIDVLGMRLGAAGHPLGTAILASLAAVVWLVLTYGVPASLLLTREHDSVLGGVNGAWLLWVVGTQSLSVAASALIPVWP